MRLGINLPAPMLQKDVLRFARQAGASAVVAHLVDYDRLERASERFDWQFAASARSLPTLEFLVELRRLVEHEDLELVAVENIDPGWWYDILLDGPAKIEQFETIKEYVRRLGEAGIPCLGYNFSLAGVWGQVWDAPAARGGARTATFDARTLEQSPIPAGEIWNMAVPDARADTTLPISREALWDRLAEFLDELTPTAEAAGVRLSAHPDDPPLPELRGTPRLLYRPEDLQRLLDTNPSPANTLTFCQGTVTEMVGDGVYDAIERFAQSDRISYVHLRNVRGQVPRYAESFVDDGDVDILAALRIYHRAGFKGVFVPDHVPDMTCPAPWHAGMAHALGYVRCALQQL